MHTYKKIALALASFSALAGCTSVNHKFEGAYQENMGKASAYSSKPISVAKEARVTEVDKPLLPATIKSGYGADWLKTQKVSLRNTGPISLQEVFKAFSKDGVNIVSDIPLDRYSYTGLSFTNLNAETALKVVLGSAGLDYVADNQRKIITIKPLSSKTWYLNIGNRKSSFVAGGSASSGAGTTGGSPAVMQPSGASAGIASAVGQGASSVQSTNIGQQGGISQISASEDFWSSLRSELDNKLKPLVPDQNGVASASGLPPPLPVPPGTVRQDTGTPASSVTTAYASKQLGTYTINPETGSISVQAPGWILGELDAYIKKVQDMYNTEITFTGELISVVVDDTQQEGLDVVAFSNFLKGSTEGIVGVTTNSLGGLTISGLTGGAITQLNDKLSRSVSNAGLALLKSKSDGTVDGLQILNAYLSTLGKVTINQKPVITTTSGVPGDFKRTTTKYYNTVSQQAAAGGTGSAAVGTQNQLVPIELGTVLRINPRMDTASGLIRAQITLEQTSQTGTQTVSQSLTAGSNLQQVVTAVPTISRIVYSGEALLKEGDLIVMGGQMENTDSVTSDGITKLKDDSNFGGLFGKKVDESRTSVFYFALKVNTSRRK